MKQRLSATILLILAVALVSGCQRSAVSSQPSGTSERQPTASHQQPTTSHQPPADLWRDPVPAEAHGTKRLLETAAVPQRDLVDLVGRFGDLNRPIPRVARDEPWDFAIGEQHNFWVQDKGTGDYRQVAAALVYETAHAYWFMEEGLEMDGRGLHNSAERFEEQIYPDNQRFFGQEWSPGVDDDAPFGHSAQRRSGRWCERLSNSLDEYTRPVFPFSNQMEMITVSGEGAELDSPAFDCTLAHEFQHVIQWAVDRDETTWLNEVFGLLACPLNGLEADYSDFIIEAFARQPDVQLNVWGTDPDDVAAQYGASQLFGAYFLERFGEAGVQVVAADAQNGLGSLDSSLRTLNSGLDGDDLFADWVAANYLDDPGLADGRYGYRELELPGFKPALVVDAESLPVEERGSVGQYAADYIVLNGPGEFQIDFAGATLVRPVPTAPHSGNAVWWGWAGTGERRHTQPGL